jgi:hypothetical protein
MAKDSIEIKGVKVRVNKEAGHDTEVFFYKPAQSLRQAVNFSTYLDPAVAGDLESGMYTMKLTKEAGPAAATTEGAATETTEAKKP